MLKTLLFVGSGSFVGGCCRYLLSQLVGSRWCHTFPASTFVVNVVGCFAIGLLFGALERYHHVDGRLGLFLLVGFCGGFTTFSTFIQDNYKLVASQQLLMPALYTGLSVVMGYVALYAGLSLVRWAGPACSNLW